MKVVKPYDVWIEECRLRRRYWRVLALKRALWMTAWVVGCFTVAAGMLWLLVGLLVTVRTAVALLALFAMLIIWLIGRVFLMDPRLDRNRKD